MNELGDHEIQFIHEMNIKIQHLDKLDGLSPETKQMIQKGVETTKNNSEIILNIAINYGSRNEILKAIRSIAAENAKPQDIDEEFFYKYLYTANIPDPDLIIRTGGEMRLSNFLLWQAAYTEFYVTPTLWSDFDSAEIEKTLSIYSQRQRRLRGLEPEG